MTIQHKNEGNHGKFFYEVEGKELALMEYHRGVDDKIIIDHTEVNASLKGQGVGKLLVEAAVKFARETETKILPMCSFAKASMERAGEAYSDVLITTPTQE